MENSGNSTTTDRHDNTHPKPTEDAGAKIETVIPDAEKEGAPHDTKVNTTDMKDNSQAYQNDEQKDTDKKNTPDKGENKDIDSKNQKTGQDHPEKDGPEVETITP